MLKSTDPQRPNVVTENVFPQESYEDKVELLSDAMLGNTLKHNADHAKEEPNFPCFLLHEYSLN